MANNARLLSLVRDAEAALRWETSACIRFPYGWPFRASSAGDRVDLTTVHCPHCGRLAWAQFEHERGLREKVGCVPHIVWASTHS